MIACEPPAATESNSCDAMTMTLKTLYNQYGECAGRLIELQSDAQNPPASAAHE